MYSRTILERFQNPRNSGGMHGANAIGQVGNPSCGDILKMYLKVTEAGAIESAKFKAFGCCGAIAACDVACDLIKGKNLDDALKVSNKDISKILGDLDANKMHCAILAEESIRAAIQDFYTRQEKESKKAMKKAAKLKIVENNNIDE